MEAGQQNQVPIPKPARADVFTIDTQRRKEMPQANLNTPPPCQETRSNARTKPSLVQTLGLGLARVQTPEHTKFLAAQPNQNKTKQLHQSAHTALSLMKWSPNETRSTNEGKMAMDVVTSLSCWTVARFCALVRPGGPDTSLRM